MGDMLILFCLRPLALFLKSKMRVKLSKSRVATQSRKSQNFIKIMFTEGHVESLSGADYSQIRRYQTSCDVRNLVSEILIEAAMAVGVLLPCATSRSWLDDIRAWLDLTYIGQTLNGNSRITWKGDLIFVEKRPMHTPSTNAPIFNPPQEIIMCRESFGV